MALISEQQAAGAGLIPGSARWRGAAVIARDPHRTTIREIGL